MLDATVVSIFLHPCQGESGWIEYPVSRIEYLEEGTSGIQISDFGFRIFQPHAGDMPEWVTFLIPHSSFLIQTTGFVSLPTRSTSTVTWSPG